MSANINLTVQNVVIKVVKILGEIFARIKTNEGSSKKKYRVLEYFQRRTKTTKFQGANRPEILWFWSKWVYNFWPAKNLYTYQDIFHSNIT